MAVPLVCSISPKDKQSWRDSVRVCSSDAVVVVVAVVVAVVAAAVAGMTAGVVGDGCRLIMQITDRRNTTIVDLFVVVAIERHPTTPKVSDNVRDSP